MNEFTDDPTVADHSNVWRRIPRSNIVLDDNLKRLRPSSQCFCQDGSLSVYIAEEAQSAEAVMQEGPPGSYLASLNVGFLRRLPLGIVRDPSSGGPGHAVLTGKKTKRIQTEMAKAATWVKPYDPQP